MVESVELKIGKTLEKIMTEERHTLASLSKNTGVPKSTLAEWLNNRAPNPSQAIRVATYLGITLHYLLFGKQDSQEAIQKIIKEDIFRGTFEITIKRIKAED